MIEYSKSNEATRGLIALPKKQKPLERAITLVRGVSKLTVL